MATGATEFIDSTTADAFIPEVWSKECIVARPQNLVFASLVDTHYRSALIYGDTVHIHNINHLAARTKAKSSNAAITYETLTESNSDISVATWEYSAIAVESIVKIQADIDLMAKYASEMGYALDVAVDDVLAGLVDDCTENTVGTMGVTLTYSDIVSGMQQLDDYNVPDETRNIVASPAQIADWMLDDKFINEDYASLHGGAGAPAGKAYKRSILGVPIFRSTNVEGSNAAGHDNVLFHKDAFALVMQMNPTSHSMYDIDYLVDKVAVEQLYGTAEMRGDHACWAKGL